MLHEKLTEAGYKQCVTDLCLYRKQNNVDVFVVVVHVDDLLVTSTSAKAVGRLFVILDSLSIKDLGRVLELFGMRVSVDKNVSYVLNQEEDIQDLLRLYGLVEEHSKLSPIASEFYEVQDEKMCRSLRTKRLGKRTNHVFTNNS